MLFKTVYGPELQCVFDFLSIHGPHERDALYRFFVPTSDIESGKSTNMDDAINFLVTAGVINKEETGKYQASTTNIGFRMLLLRQMREIQIDGKEGVSRLDPWYLKLVEDVFVRPDRRVVFGLHQHFNLLELPEVLSEEKVNAWKRVLEFLGLGIRIFGGFFCVYALDLVKELIEAWGDNEGPLQTFLELGVGEYLPWQNEAGDISSALWLPLLELERQGFVHLEQRQDLAYRSYGGERQVKWICRGGDICASMYKN